jgi:hypothetical protein
MRLIDFNWQPTQRQLKQFAVICLFALPGIGWVWGVSNNVLAILACVGVLVASIGFAFPNAIKPLFIALTLIATPIGMIVGELAMLMIYFGVFLPFGLIFRLIGRDALQLKLDRTRTTYWQTKKQPSNDGSYYRQS